MLIEVVVAAIPLRCRANKSVSSVFVLAYIVFGLADPTTGIRKISYKIKFSISIKCHVF
jgi:hypothetical protein